MGWRRPYWTYQLLGWGTNALVQSYMALDKVPGPPVRVAIAIWSVNLLGLMLSHLLRHFMKRHSWQTLGPTAVVPRVALASLLLALSLALVMHLMAISTLWTGPPELSELTGPVGSWFVQTPFVSQTANWSVIFAAWTGLYLAITSLRERQLLQRRHLEINHALQAAELHLLKSQLKPEFLFDTLNNVRALIADDPSRAQNAVTTLARTLRYTLNATRDEVISVERELEIVTAYLDLEALRLGERLRVERDIEADALHAVLPMMLLQTLVENAVKHGIAELPEGGIVHIRALLHGRELRIEVQNPRPSVAALPASAGLGLQNASERLRRLFGAAATLELDLSQQQRALARIRIQQPEAG